MFSRLVSNPEPECSVYIVLPPRSTDSYKRKDPPMADLFLNGNACESYPFTASLRAFAARNLGTFIGGT
jgi:hypothetical protein